MAKVCPQCAHHYTVRVKQRCPRCKLQTFYVGEDIAPTDDLAVIFDRITLEWAVLTKRGVGPVAAEEQP